MSKKILIVEDTQLWVDFYQQGLEGKDVTIISALTVEEAETAFFANSNIDLIVMDFSVPRTRTSKLTVDTLPLVRKFRETFPGPMIAASLSLFSSKILINMGCNSMSSKEDVPGNVISILCL